jgi:glycosyltransferase involved in cell wall biosynthesis
MKIAFITGSYPPDICGVGDYTCQLEKALTARGITTEVIGRTDWSIENLNALVRTIRSADPDLVHMQYPTVGYGWKITPQLLSLAVPGVITLHEVTEAHILRKLSLYPFSFRSRHIIFTTPFERDFAIQRAPWIARRSSVIPIGSNITTGVQGRARDRNEIVYFGLFRPKKGIEEVFELASLVKERNLPYHIHMIGKPFPVSSPYHTELYRRSQNLPIQWSTDLDDRSVADLLARAAMAYMPFPDGASGRRGSLLALLANGVITMTTRGPQTPSSLEKAVLFVEGCEQALSTIERVHGDSDLRERLCMNGHAYASQFSWDSIARQHVELYRKLLA